MKTRKPDLVRLAYIGYGKHSLQSHTFTQFEVPGLHITGTYDPRGAFLPKIEQKLGYSIRRYYSEEDLLADPEVDAVFIGTPDNYHAESLLKVVQANKHVFVEKPLAMNTKDMHSMEIALTLAEEQGNVVSSCHPRRYDRPFLYTQRKLPDLMHQLGMVLSITYDFSYHVTPKRGDAWKKERGLLIDHFSHEIDVVRFLMGPMSFECHKVYDAYDRYEVAGLCEDNVSFYFSGTRRLPEHVFPELLRIRFERGAYEINTKTGFASWTNHGAQRLLWPARSFRYAGATDYYVKFRDIMRNFVGSIQGNQEPYLTVDDLLVNNRVPVELTEDGVSSWTFA